MDNISTDKQKLINGINKVCDAVKITLGGAGANAILEEDLQPFHIITNDGISIAEKIKLNDPVENIGANLMKEVAIRANKESGDGTTTTMVLTQAILNEGIKIKASPMEVKRSLDECLPIINKCLDEQKKEITVDNIKSVALTSSEDETLSQLLQDIYKEIGPNGIIELDNSNTADTFYEITEGVRLRNTGFIPSLVPMYKKQEVWNKPKILIIKQEINTNTQLEPIYIKLKESGITEIVLLVDQIDNTSLSAIAHLHQNGIMKTLVLKAPTLFKDWIYEDFAKITGATIIDTASGTGFKTFKTSYLGECDKIIATSNETRILGIKDISEHIKSLEEIATDDSKIRLSWLQTKAGILKLGANSESELSYKRLKVEDARNATYQALQSGVVAGGGVALVNCVDELPNTVGGDILKQALLRPIQQIIINTGLEKEEKTYELGGDLGFDTRTMTVINMWEAGILDPVSVVKNSIKDAISVAGTVLTANVIITKK